MSNLGADSTAAADLPLPYAATPADSHGGYSTREKALVLAAAFLGWMFDGLEMGIFPQISRPALTELLKRSPEFAQALTTSPEFTHAYGWWNQFIAAMFLWGAAAGGLIFGWLGDRIGRVKAMSISILIY